MLHKKLRIHAPIGMRARRLLVCTGHTIKKTAQRITVFSNDTILVLQSCSDAFLKYAGVHLRRVSLCFVLYERCE